MEVQEKSLHMTVLMTPEMANFAGNVHGGALLKLLDQVAYACAARYCKSYVVTVSLDQVAFKEPIRVGELVTFRANVNYVGKSSMEVGVRVMAEDLRSKTRRHTNSCYFTMVAMGEDGKPIPAPPLEISTTFERKLYEAAAMRRDMRREVARRNEEITAGIPDYNSD
ncbi:MAG: acyl-CoA thioesterase [Gammaproteobacteria bacterium]|nr:acyl-CoA thioesterase [Gammaproteobacteria bacterium]